MELTTILLDQILLVVETLEKKREPIPTMEAIYFLTPSGEIIIILLSGITCSLQRKASSC